MTKKFDLAQEVKTFATEMNGLLNATVAEHAHLTPAAMVPGQFLVGHRLSAKALAERRVFALRAGARVSAPLQMQVLFRLEADEQGRYLQVASSVFALYGRAVGGVGDDHHELLHFDYERDKQHGYPEAHIQVAADSPAWSAAVPNRGLSKLHLPVGGRRFRVTLEDVVDFLVCEQLAGAAGGTSKRLESSRESFRRKQLRAAVRRDPDTARKMLSELDTS